MKLSTKESIQRNGGLATPKGTLSTSRTLDPLDSAESHLDDADAATRLLEYSADINEDTARHDITVTVNPQPTPPSPSSPQLDVTQQAPGVLRVVFTVVQKFPAWGSVLVALAAIAGYVFLKYTGSVK